MPPTANDVLAARRGLVVAPAGCGKTELIVETLKVHSGHPALILTHTNAGVAALRDRLARASVSTRRFRLATIDGWALRLVSTYPFRTGSVIDLTANIDYLFVRELAANLLTSHALNDVLNATYSRILVDEYQDCSIRQHTIIVALAEQMPTCVFGDPLQAIFGFGDDPLAAWSTVTATFPQIGELDIPWRWKKVGADDLGNWIRVVRQQLETTQPINLITSCQRVVWKALTGNFATDIQAQTQAQSNIKRQIGEKLLVIGDAAKITSRHEYARRAYGVAVVEPVELGDLVIHANLIDGRIGEPLLDAVLTFAGKVMTGINVSSLKKRLRTLSRGVNRTPATEEEIAAGKVFNNGGLREAIAFLRSLREGDGRRIFRRFLLGAMLETIDQACASTTQSVTSAAVAVREQRRHLGRRIPNRAIGSTLLFKGLEADHVLILNADEMNKTHLYVALSRGVKSLTIFSKNQILRPCR